MCRGCWSLQSQEDKNVDGFSDNPRRATSISDRERVAEIVANMKHMPGALLPVLHAVQDALGCVPAGVVSTIADGLNLSRAEVHGVISFYHHFRSEQAGRQIIQLCRAEACQAVGARQLEQHVTSRLQIAMGATTENGAVTLLPVYCLGNCACGPSMQIDDEIYARVTPEAFDTLLGDMEAGR